MAMCSIPSTYAVLLALPGHALQPSGAAPDRVGEEVHVRARTKADAVAAARLSLGKKAAKVAVLRVRGYHTEEAVHPDDLIDADAVLAAAAKKGKKA